MNKFAYVWKILDNCVNRMMNILWKHLNITEIVESICNTYNMRLILLLEHVEGPSFWDILVLDALMIHKRDSSYQYNASVDSPMGSQQERTRRHVVYIVLHLCTKSGILRENTKNPLQNTRNNGTYVSE